MQEIGWVGLGEFRSSNVKLSDFTLQSSLICTAADQAARFSPRHHASKSSCPPPSSPLQPSSARAQRYGRTTRQLSSPPQTGRHPATATATPRARAGPPSAKGAGGDTGRLPQLARTHAGAHMRRAGGRRDRRECAPHPPPPRGRSKVAVAAGQQSRTNRLGWLQGRARAGR
ncbi:hypothetical protein PAHAL_8G218900 [Panicum hallii]|uniref:Uncharacterized protein n=1 Tax=Panicum hallii TaxID=206008 RepID=A0A2T8I9U4_9POAL|nr:hypothetical protein PAHAL_8G218900 [Panicum hallii]